MRPRETSFLPLAGLEIVHCSSGNAAVHFSLLPSPPEVLKNLGVAGWRHLSGTCQASWQLLLAGRYEERATC